MVYYNLRVPLSKENVQTLKKEFAEYLERSGGFTVEVHTVNDEEDEDYTAVTDTLTEMFGRLVQAVMEGNFEGVN